jgi:hypothetical protein
LYFALGALGVNFTAYYGRPVLLGGRRRLMEGPPDRENLV